MAGFRYRNYNLPIESGCRTNIPRNLRVCELCNDSGDEFHFLFICPRFNEARKNTLTRLHKSRSSRDELEFDLSNFV